ncbi:MAG: DUF262 domain-containing protein [Bacteroidetes bacterium]|nr:DUF262 domain-containing protein [Bacteroidota bacterium]
MNGINRLLLSTFHFERDKDDPQRIFESLNSTGLELSQADLIRNYILMDLKPDQQQRIFSEFWEIIENNAKDYELNETRVSDFIRDYLTAKIKRIPVKSKVYEEFKNRYSDRNSVFYSETLNELKEFSYHLEINNPSQESDPEISKELHYINQLEVNVAYPF